MSEYEANGDPDGLPEMHVAANFDNDHHVPYEDCWCSPEIEFKTDYVRVYRHRRFQ